MDQAWGWRPELGRWQLDRFGYPDMPTYVAISTNGVPAKASYDYWRDIAFSDFEADRLVTGETPQFRARASGMTSRRADFFESASGAVSGGRTRAHIERDGLDGISIGLVARGRRWAEQQGGSQQRTGPGELFAYDAARPSTVTWSAHDASYLVVRRSDAVEAFGDDVPDTAELARRLAASPMRHLVADQFRRVARHHQALDAVEQAFLLDQTVQLTLFALARRSENGQPMAEDRALFHTALRFISTNLADPTLDAAKVAAALAISRATLYRAFAVQGVGVAETIRNLRLERARHLLEHSRAALSIGEIALHCGLYDTANFSRLFRHRYGAPPSQFRNSKN